MKMLNKKGQAGGVIAGLISAVLGIVVLGLLLTYTADIVQDVSDDQTAGTAARNATDSGLVAINNLSSNTPLLATVIIFAVILGVVVTFLAVRKSE